MPIRRASLIQPHRRPEDFPTHLSGERAAELLSAATALWHPALIHATGSLPSSRSADDLPDPTEFENELVVLPFVSRQRLSPDWCDRFRTTVPLNAPPVAAVASRSETLSGLLNAAGLSGTGVDPDVVGDFLALGFAHLQVELLTRAMHYTSVLDEEHFAEAVVAAASAAVGGNNGAAREDLGRAFDLLADARNHVYSVDFFVIDITLLADTTLGDNLRQKLAAGRPTNVLACGELLDKLATEHPQSLAAMREASEAGTASVIGGLYHDRLPAFFSPEELLAELELGRQASCRHLNRDYQVFSQFHTNFSPLMPLVLLAMGFRGALHASFDGGRLPRADQRKTFWGEAPDVAIETLAATPRDIALPETWLKLAGRIADTIAHDHVATVALAGWPGAHSEYYDDFRRATRYGPALGKLVTLDEYFRVSREVDEWTTFHPPEYACQIALAPAANPISSSIAAYRRNVHSTHRQLSRGLAALVGGPDSNAAAAGEPFHPVALNPWSFPRTLFSGVDPLSEQPGSTHRNDFAGAFAGSDTPVCLPDVPGCGFATLAAAAPAASIALAGGHTLRNESLEVTVNQSTGGIQSIRTHRDRGTRASQRLACQQGGAASLDDCHMVADEIVITRNDPLIGEITSRGRLLDSADTLLTRFTQRVRIARGLSAVMVEIELDPQRELSTDLWRSYFASRLACSGDAIAVRRGRHWLADGTAREKIESPEWVEINDGIGTVTVLALGLPFHRRATAAWLDTLLLVAGETQRRFQFAIAIDEPYPSRAAFNLLTVGQTPFVTLPESSNASRGWFLHIGARNVVMTHLEPLTEAAGLRVRLLETEGRDVEATFSAFRPFRTARTTDFRGNSTGVLSASDGGVGFQLAAHRWIQIEAEW
jgi:alpha-mannosidase